MKDIYIAYNPFTRKTKVTIDGKEPEENSWFRDLDGKRLQEWVDDFPIRLREYTNDGEFKVKYHGLPLDYEDVRSVLKNTDSGIVVKEIEFLPPINTDEVNRERKIEEIFAKIQSQDCPFASLRDDTQLKSAFENVKDSSFNVFVVATMSSGKSTLINALLGQKLMPSKQEACTAIITKIKDDDEMAGQPFEAMVYKNDANRPVHYGKLDLDIMEKLNSDVNVKEIRARGQIPFVDSSRISLVLVDTPGPNNKRNEQHREVQREFLDKNAKPLVLYIMTGEFGNDSDYELLSRIAESMNAGGKAKKGELRDRFLFVVNKLDGRKKEDGDIQVFMKNIEEYLNGQGIDMPQLFPVAALPAMNIQRLMNRPDELDEDELDEVETSIRKLNNRLHLEEQATLPMSIRREIDNQLKIARETWQEIPGRDAKNNPNEAWIHTGVPSVELAIRQYVEKYAYSAKIKNLVDTFMNVLETIGAEETLKNAMLKSSEEEKRIKENIALVQERLNSANNIKSQKDNVENAVKNTIESADDGIEQILNAIQIKITQKSIKGKDYNIDLEQIPLEISDLNRLADKLQNEFINSMEDLINNGLTANCDSIIDSYRKQLHDIGMSVGADRLIDPSKLMLGDIKPEEITRDALRSIQTTESRKVGEKWVENTNKKWWKPWTWGEEKGYWKEIYQDVQVVPLDKLVNTYFTPMEQALNENCDNARRFIEEQATNVANYVNGIIQKLDAQLSQKLNELRSYQVDHENLERQKAKIEANIDWLNNIKTEVRDILSI